MEEFFANLAFWHWFIFGGLLLLGEMLAPGAILLWPGIAALLIGMLTFAAADLPWTVTVPLWAILSVVTAFGWRAYRQKNPAPVSAAASTLNERGSQYIGHHYTLTKPVINGVGEVKVGDSVWRVISDHDFIAGATVKVIAVEGTSLRVEAV